MTKDEFIDLDKLDVPKRTVKIGGELIDISRMPTIVNIKLQRYKEVSEKIKKGKVDISEADHFENLVDIIALGCKMNPKITKQWLIENTDIAKLMALMNAITKSRSKKGTDDSKNGVQGVEK